MQNNYLVMILNEHINYVHPASIAECEIKMSVVL